MSEWSWNAEEEFIQESFSIDSKALCITDFKNSAFIYINNPEISMGMEMK